MGVICLALSAASARAQVVLPYPGNINTVAGDGAFGYAGDGGLATNAAFYSPLAVAVDTSGNIYIADGDSYRIRKVTASTGIITTVAGDGTPGYSGDGGLATNAEINPSTGVAVDTSGNIYIVDTYYNSRIRKVTASTGIISTVAGDGTAGYSGDGGLATNAELYYASGVAVDTSGNIYIADSGNYRIRKVTASTGIITTVAGDGTCCYSGDGGPATNAELDAMGVAVDTSGNIYIADYGFSRIRKVTASTGIIATVAGDGTLGYSGDGGLATNAEINPSYGVAVDTSGNIYIADTGNYRIRKVTASTGIITTIAGDGTPGYSGDGGPATSAELANFNDSAVDGVAVDTSDNIYIADTYNGRIRAVGPPATATVVATMTLGSAGNSSAGTAPQRKNLTQCYTGCSGGSPTGAPATAYCTTAVQTSSETAGCSAEGAVPTLSYTNPGSGSLASLISSGGGIGGVDTPSALTSSYGTSADDSYCTSDPYKSLASGYSGLTLPGCVADSTATLLQTTSGTSTDSLFPATWVVSGSSHNADLADHYIRESWWSIPCSTYSYLANVEYDTNYSAGNGQYYGFGLQWSKEAPLAAGGNGQMFQYLPQGGAKWRTFQFNPVSGGSAVTTFPVSCGEVIHTRVFMHRGSTTACTNSNTVSCFFYDQMYVQNCGSSAGTCASSPAGTLYNLTDALTGAIPGGIPKDNNWAAYEPDLQVQIDAEVTGTASVNFDSDSLVIYYF